MSRAICIADLYGLGGLATSPGMLTLADKIRSLGANFAVLGPYAEFGLGASGRRSRQETRK